MEYASNTASMPNPMETIIKEFKHTNTHTHTVTYVGMCAHRCTNSVFRYFNGDYDYAKLLGTTLLIEEPGFQVAQLRF